jgi:hypothetical protein
MEDPSANTAAGGNSKARNRRLDVAATPPVETSIASGATRSVWKEVSGLSALFLSL